MFLDSPGQLAETPKRIISLVPSQTEILHYFGLENETIAITKFCVHPLGWFHNKTRIGGTKAINIEKVMELKPDLVIANKEENIKEQVEAIAAHFPVWVTDVNKYQDALNMIHDVGQLTGKNSQAEVLSRKIEKEFEYLKHFLSNQKPKIAAIKVAYLIWKDPYMTVGRDTYINDMIEMAGFQNVFSSFERYPEITLSQLESSQCNLILLSSEPYPFSKKHIEILKENLPEIQCILVDGEMFSWYGSRMLLAPGYFQHLWADIAFL